MTTDVPPGLGAAALPRYRRPAGVHPPLAYAGYRSTLLRAPKRPSVTLPQWLTEVTGPLPGAERGSAADADLTTGQAGEPIGERGIVAGRGLDPGGRPGPGNPVELS